MGSLIQQRGFQIEKHLWTTYLNITNPELIKSLHKDYINAGCDIITTNTFRTNPCSLTHGELELTNERVVELSIQIAKDAKGESQILIAGSNAPAEDCYQSERTISVHELKENHHRHIDYLFKHGTDLILNETQSHWDEIEIICKYCMQNNVPFMISLFITEELKILSGENIDDVVEMIKSFNPLLISFNCITNSVFSKLASMMKFDFDWGFYLNCGSGEYTEQNIRCGLDPVEYSEIVRSMLIHNPKLIGACCGSNPKHIETIKHLFNE